MRNLELAVVVRVTADVADERASELVEEVEKSDGADMQKTTNINTTEMNNRQAEKVNSQ